MSPVVDRVWTRCRRAPMFVANSWISPYRSADATGYRSICSKGPQTESSVADANQRR